MKSLSDNIATAASIHETEESAKNRHLAVMKDLKIVKYGIAAILVLQTVAVIVSVLL